MAMPSSWFTGPIIVTPAPKILSIEIDVSHNIFIQSFAMLEKKVSRSLVIGVRFVFSAITRPSRLVIAIFI